MGDVEAAVAAPASGRVAEWASNLARRLEDLRTAFDRHVELTEAPSGFLAQIVADAPRLANAVNKLRAEHELISASIERMLSSLHAAIPGSDDAVAEAREQALELLKQLARHRHQGADLVYEAFNVDIEGGD
jgi:ElaB/YqjD/DUF883 family membrane-anchored ribosome-binding protein